MERAKLKELGLTDEQIEAVMTDHGKAVNTALEGKNTLATRVTELEEELAKYADYASLKEEVTTLRAGNEELVNLRAYKEDREYGDRFTAAVGDKKFVNDVTANHVRSGFIAAAKDPANEGKTDADLLTVALGGKEADYLKSKVSISMTPMQMMPRGGEDITSNGIKMIPYNP